jgi:hypothetical protein
MRLRVLKRRRERNDRAIANHDPRVAVDRVLFLARQRDAAKLLRRGRNSSLNGTV